MAIWGYLLFALAAGAMLPIQFGINAQLAAWVGSPVRAALVSFVAVRCRSAWWPSPSPVTGGDGPTVGPPGWIGGALGFYVLGSSRRRLGAACSR